MMPETNIVRMLNEAEKRQAIDCFAKASAFLVRIDDLAKAIQIRPLTRAVREEVAADYKALKNELRDEGKKIDTSRGEAKLSGVEKELCIVLKSAGLRLRPATNSHPIHSRWHSALYEARIDLEFYANDWKDILNDNE